jgi:type IV pilus assembly protein PilA
MREDIRRDLKQERAAMGARRAAGRAGFTLIELLIVVVIIGILASIAIPKFGSTKEKAYIAKMKSDLRNLATAQESYLGDNQVYYGGGIPNAAFTFNPSSGVTVTMVSANTSGWSATTAYVGSTKTCALSYGSAAPVAPATAEGLIACDP